MNLLAAVLLLALSALQLRAEKPNILFIFADDIGYEALNCYGGKDFETPRLNQMASEGLRFARAYTSPACTPSRVSLHTGLHTFQHGSTNILPVHTGTKRIVDFTKMPTFAQLLRKNGYQTSVTGKWQLATLEQHPDHIRNAGFDSWCIWQIWRDGAKTTRFWNPTFNHDGKVRDDIAQRYGPDVLADYVIDQMTSARDAKEPFFILHNELLPHEPITETPEDRKLKRPATLGHMVGYMDHLVGRLLDAVDELGIRENTYVIFMGDNGTEANHLNPRNTEAGEVFGGKRDLTDAGTHVPLIIWGPPGVPAGKVCEDLVDVVDFFPTLCELTETAQPKRAEQLGRSIVPQIHGKPGPSRLWTHQAFAKGESLFDGGWRLDKSGKLTDSRKLPKEIASPPKSEATEAARKRLKETFSGLPE